MQKLNIVQQIDPIKKIGRFPYVFEIVNKDIVLVKSWKQLMIKPVYLASEFGPEKASMI